MAEHEMIQQVETEQFSGELNDEALDRAAGAGATRGTAAHCLSTIVDI
jgi:hypothetical protein